MDMGCCSCSEVEGSWEKKPVGGLGVVEDKTRLAGQTAPSSHFSSCLPLLQPFSGNRVVLANRVLEGHHSFFSGSLLSASHTLKPVLFCISIHLGSAIESPCNWTVFSSFSSQTLIERLNSIVLNFITYCMFRCTWWDTHFCACIISSNMHSVR